MIRQSRGGTVLYIGSVHSVEASPLKAPYVTADRPDRARPAARQGRGRSPRSDQRDLPRLRSHAPRRSADPEEARDLGLTEDEVVKKVMLRETVDGEFTTAEDIAEVAVFFAAFPSLALTGQSLVVSHGWHMQ